MDAIDFSHVFLQKLWEHTHIWYYYTYKQTTIFFCFVFVILCFIPLNAPRWI